MQPKKLNLAAPFLLTNYNHYIPCKFGKITRKKIKIVF